MSKCKCIYKQCTAALLKFTYMAEDGKLAQLCTVLLAWSKETQNEKNVQSAQRVCPRKRK